MSSIDRANGAGMLSDIQTLRERARRHIDAGAVTPGYRADVQKIVGLLNEALATEIVCVLRYKRHYFMANGPQAEVAAKEFAEHAAEEAAHADRIADRIVAAWRRARFLARRPRRARHAEYVEGRQLADMIKEDLVAERIAIDSYRELIDFLGNDDPTTRRMLEEILATEEEHADDLARLLARDLSLERAAPP